MAAKPIPLHKMLRNLEAAYARKMDELIAANKRIAELEQLKDKSNAVPVN
jgi:hypothetical protein